MRDWLERLLLKLVLRNLSTIMATQEEVLAAIAAVKTNVEDINTKLVDISSDVDALKELVGSGANLDEIASALNDLSAKVDEVETASGAVADKWPEV